MRFKVLALVIATVFIFFSTLLIPWRYGDIHKYSDGSFVCVDMTPPERPRGIIDIYFYRDNVSLLPRTCNLTVANAYVKQSWFGISNITLNTAIFEGWNTTWSIEYNTDNARYRVSFVVSNISALYRDIEFFLYDFSEFDHLNPMVFAKEVDDTIYINTTYNNLSWNITLYSALGGFCLIAQVLNNDSYSTGGYMLDNILSLIHI